MMTSKAIYKQRNGLGGCIQCNGRWGENVLQMVKTVLWGLQKILLFQWG